MCAYLKMCSLLQICVQYCIDDAYVVEIKLNSRERERERERGGGREGGSDGGSEREGR